MSEQTGGGFGKALKAELLRLGWFLVKTHDVQDLAEELRVRQSDLFPAFKPLCDALAERYFTDRYPGFDLEEPKWQEFRQLVQQMTEVLAKVKARVAAK